HPIIPFITEELWQKVSVVAGKRKPNEETSISVQPYPVSNPAAMDDEADAQVAELKAQVEAVRALRGEMNLSPGQRVPLIARGDRAVLERNSEYLKSLARLEGVEIVDALPQLGAPVQIVGTTGLMLHVEIDVAAERSRLGKEIERLEGESAKWQGRLSDERFGQRASAKVGEQEKEPVPHFRGPRGRGPEQLKKRPPE